MNLNFPTNTQQPYLNLPEPKWPYFWELAVDGSYVYLKVKMRHWWWPFRYGQIESKNSDYVNHKGDLTQLVLDEMAERAVEMARDYDPTKTVLKQFKAVKFNVAVRVKKY